MSELLLSIPTNGTWEEINAYFDGAAAGIRLYATWKDGHQFVGMMGRRLVDALTDLEDMRDKALEDHRKMR